jgi:hypothetical protein
LSLTTAIFWTSITSVVLIAVGAIDQQTNILSRIAPAEVWFIFGILILVGSAINMFIAIVHGDTAPAQSPRLPNLATMVKAWLFPAPPAHRYNARTQRTKP